MHDSVLKKSLENKEDKEKIIDNEEEARQKFRNFWKKDNSPEALRKEVEEMDFKRYQDDFWTEYLLRNQKNKRKRSRDYKPNEIFFVSGNPDKQNELSEITTRRGIKVLSQNKLHNSGESAIHTYLKKCIAEGTKRGSSYRQDYSPESYSLDVAWLKVANIFKDNYTECKNNPVMASDVVVLQGEEVFEKCKNEKEAFEALMNLSGKEVTVSCGIYLYTKTKSGKEFTIYEGANLTIKLSDFSESEAEEYIENIKKQGKDILSIAGVIDYSSMEAQSLIDKNQAVRVEPLKQGNDYGDSVLISSEILPDLRDYFKGMPKELLEEMLNRQQALEKV